jgi:hypothetical protein
LSKKLFAAFLLLCAGISAIAGGRKDAVPVIQITGRVRLVGSSPLAQIVISAENGEWYIERNEQYKLWDLQQKIVTVEGVETVEELTFANGLSAGIRRTLKNIKIISIN